jgi:ATP-dependent RNA helicase DeaD
LFEARPERPAKPVRGEKAARADWSERADPPASADQESASDDRPATVESAGKPAKPNRGKPPREREPARETKGAFSDDEAPRAKRTGATAAMETYRIEVGHVHSVKPGNIVGAIANESGIDGVYIGRVDIREDHSYVDLPEGMPKKIFKDLQKVRIAGRELRISRVMEKPPKPRRDPAGRHEKLKIRS